jgi:hypothetical protein
MRRDTAADSEGLRVLFGQLVKGTALDAAAVGMSHADDMCMRTVRS